MNRYTGLADQLTSLHQGDALLIRRGTAGELQHRSHFGALKSPGGLEWAEYRSPTMTTCGLRFTQQCAEAETTADEV
jgi:hypothetical protein